jgi:hypothetical protein
MAAGEPAPRAKEDGVLLRVRRAATLAMAVAGGVLPALIVIVDGAKRW